MVATIGLASQAGLYLERQRSYRHPNEYLRGGEEPDGVWWNPSGLFGLADGGRVDSRDFFRLHDGMAPDGSGKLTHNDGGAKRSRAFSTRVWWCARAPRDGQRAAGLAAAMIAGLSRAALPAWWHKRR